MDIVTKVWNDPGFLIEGNTQKRIVWKLQALKQHTRNWYKDRIKLNKAKLLELEADIKEHINMLINDPTNLGAESIWWHIEMERNGLLLKEEEKWRLCSRALWLASGDGNTKYFHNFASHNKVKKIIWDIKGENDESVNDHALLKKEVVLFFKNFYKATNCPNIAEQCSLIDYFPQMIDEENSRLLFKPVTLEELKNVLFHFKKEKSLGPDGWTAKFFI
jgi:hypothetical protein